MANSVDFIIVPLLFVSSQNNAIIKNIHAIATKLVEKNGRVETANKLARICGADDLLIFTLDKEVQTLLPAEGFIQTLSDAKKWDTFLNECIKSKIFKDNIPHPSTNKVTSAIGLAYKDECVFVFLGGKPSRDIINSVFTLIPLLSTVLGYEQQIIHKDADLNLANTTLVGTQAIAKKLDIVRRDLQNAVIKNEKEIRSRKQIELKLKLEQKRIYDLFMQAPAMIAVCKGPDFIYELANPLFLKVVGKSDEIIGKPLLEVFPEVKNQPILKILKNVYKTGEPFNGKEILVNLDTNEDGKLEDLYFNFIYQPTRNADGKIDGVMTHAIDVTTQVEARRKIEEAESKFRALADNIPNLTWMANADGYIYWYNSRWFEYTGTSPKEMEGWGWQSVHDPKVLPIVLKQWKTSIKKELPFEMIFPLKGADNVFRPFLTRVVPIFDEKGKLIQWFGTNTDITKQKELERQKDDFLGIASHELKTPVTSIKAYGQVLQTIFQRKGDTKATDLLAKMDAQVNKLTSLIADLLDVTKLQSGRMEFHEDFFDFNELIYELVEQMQLTTEKHKLMLQLTRTRSVFGDRERISQVITNLISNAIKYSPHTDKIIIKSESQKDKITLCVKDFGVGIPKDKQDRVFEQFYRVSGLKESTFPGLGLGLYVSSEIIKREGGQIWVESVEGKGSTFCFSLPLSKKASKQELNKINKQINAL